MEITQTEHNPGGIAMRTFGCVLTLVVLLAAAAGCGGGPRLGGADSAAGGDAGAAADGVAAESAAAGGALAAENMAAVSGAGAAAAGSAGAADETQAGRKLTIRAYYADDQLTGLKEADREIDVSPGRSKYEYAFEALQTETDGLVPLWKHIVLNRIEFAENSGRLNIDISIPDHALLGAGGEALALEALQRTIFQFDEVRQIELTVDGRRVESLMGHVSLDHPLLRPPSR